VAAAIFWMKARAGWREKHELELSTRTVRQVTDAELMGIVSRSIGSEDVEGALIQVEQASRR
jgi:hypothetical protein